MGPGHGGTGTKDERICRLLDECLSVSAMREFGLFRIMFKMLEFLMNVCRRSAKGSNSCPQHAYGSLGEVTVAAERVPYMAGFLGMSEVVAGGVKSGDPDIAMYGLLCVAMSHAFFDIRMKDLCTPQLFDNLERFARHAYEAFQGFMKDNPSSGNSEAVLYFEDEPEFFDAPPKENPGDDESASAHKAGGNGFSKGVHTLASVLCWAAADRLSLLSMRYLKDKQRAQIWQACAAEMHEVILNRAWNTQKKAFTSFWGGDKTGPSLLRLVEVGFLRPHDERFISTVAAFEMDGLNASLSESGRRPSVTTARSPQMPIKAVDSQAAPSPTKALAPAPGNSQCFSTNTLLWYCEALRNLGREAEARRIVCSLLQCSRPAGILAESIDLKTSKQWGNYPSTPALISFIRVASRISKSWRGV